MCSSKSTRRACRARAGTARRSARGSGRRPRRPCPLRGGRGRARGRRRSPLRAAPTSSSERSVESLNGDSRASQRISFACARPMPASARWSRRRGWSWRRSRAEDLGEPLRPEVERVRAEVRELRLELLGREQPDARALLLAGLGEHELAAVGEARGGTSASSVSSRRARGSGAGRRSSGGRGARARRPRWGRGGSCRGAARRRSVRPSSAASGGSNVFSGRDVRRAGALDRRPRDERVELAHPRLDLR